MDWKQFLEVAYPPDLAIKESQKNIIYRSHRWIGLRLAYIFYHLKIPAEVVVLGRIILAIISFYFLSLVIRGDIILPLIAAFLLYGQNILDYADGAVARAWGRATELGGAWDGIVNVFARGAILVLLAIFSGNILVIILSIFSLFILMNFRNEVGTEISDGNVFKFIESFYRLVLSIQFMLFILPLLIALTNVFNWQLLVFSYICTGFYFGLAILWLIFCFWKKNK